MLNVLIVDDDPSFQETYRSFLDRQGYRSRLYVAHEGRLGESGPNTEQTLGESRRSALGVRPRG